MSYTKCTREEALADIKQKGMRPFESIPGKIWAAPPECCLFCKYASRFCDPEEYGRPYMIICSEAPKDPINENDDWVDIGMRGECLTFKEENDEN